MKYFLFILISTSLLITLNIKNHTNKDANKSDCKSKLILNSPKENDCNNILDYEFSKIDIHIIIYTHKYPFGIICFD